MLPRVREYLPAEQGLRPARAKIERLHIVFVREHLPAEQGLRPGGTSSQVAPSKVRENLPAEKEIKINLQIWPLSYYPIQRAALQYEILCSFFISHLFFDVSEDLSMISTSTSCLSDGPIETFKSYFKLPLKNVCPIQI